MLSAQICPSSLRTATNIPAPYSPMRLKRLWYYRYLHSLSAYIRKNKSDITKKLVMPRTNISAYLGSASYMEMYESRIPEGFMEKKPEMGGVSAVRINV